MTIRPYKGYQVPRRLSCTKGLIGGHGTPCPYHGYHVSCPQIYTTQLSLRAAQLQNLYGSEKGTARHKVTRRVNHRQVLPI